MKTRQLKRDVGAANAFIAELIEGERRAQVWVCEHCGRDITDKKAAWSRSRKHWCSWLCMFNDGDRRK